MAAKNCAAIDAMNTIYKQAVPSQTNILKLGDSNATQVTYQHLTRHDRVHGCGEKRQEALVPLRQMAERWYEVTDNMAAAG